MQGLLQNETFVGKRVLVTGGNRGLGRGIAVQVAALGGQVTFTARSPRADVLKQMQAEVADQAFAVASTKLGSLAMVQLDLSDLSSIDKLVQQDLRDAFDVVILNAGVAPQTNQETAQGFELALGVNCIGHHYLTERLIERQLISDRLIVVTSETFRAAAPLDLSTLFDPVEYGLSDALLFYARSKLAVNTLSNELLRRHDGDLHVHLICPGPVATNLANQAPDWLKPTIQAVMKLLFQSPTAAARPVRFVGVQERERERGAQAGRHTHTHTLSLSHSLSLTHTHTLSPYPLR